jgi:hypothetical protein
MGRLPGFEIHVSTFKEYLEQELLFKASASIAADPGPFGVEHLDKPNRSGSVRSERKLSLSYSEHLGATGWTYALSGWFAVFHSYTLGVLHLFFCSAFDAIGFHLFTPFHFVL